MYAVREFDRLAAYREGACLPGCGHGRTARLVRYEQAGRRRFKLYCDACEKWGRKAVPLRYVQWWDPGTNP